MIVKKGMTLPDNLLINFCTGLRLTKIFRYTLRKKRYKKTCHWGCTFSKGKRLSILGANMYILGANMYILSVNTVCTF